MKSSPFLVVVIVCVAQCMWVASLRVMEEMYYWDRISFVYDSPEQRQFLIDDGRLIPGNSVPFDVDKDPKTGRVFISIPRLLDNSAVTLATIEDPTVRYNPVLRPYPDWSWHANYSGCEGLVSVFRTQIDKCGRMWFVDSGIDFGRGTYRSLCPPKVLVFNLTTNKEIARQIIAPSVALCSSSLIINIVTEPMDDSCGDDVYAYLADGGAYRLYTFHLRSRRVWRVPNDFLLPDIRARLFRIDHTVFPKMVGVLGLALSPCLLRPGPGPGCERYLYFHPFTSYNEGRFLTSHLHDEPFFLSVAETPFVEADVEILGPRPAQSVAEAMSKDSIMFFGMFGQHSVNCWNQKNPYDEEHIHEVEFDLDRISFPMGVKIVEDPEEELWFLSNNIQYIFAFQDFPNSTYPIHVMRGKVEDLLAGGGCL